MERLTMYMGDKIGFIKSVQEYYVSLGYFLQQIKKEQKSADITYFSANSDQENVCVIVKWSLSNIGDKAVRKAHNMSVSRGFKKTVIFTNTEFNTSARSKAEYLNITLIDRHMYTEKSTFSIEMGSCVEHTMAFLGIESKSNPFDKVEQYQSKDLSPYTKRNTTSAPY